MAAETILILGESGVGKSTSLRNLNPEETFIICTTSKPLPWKGWKKNPPRKRGTTQSKVRENMN